MYRTKEINVGKSCLHDDFSALPAFRGKDDLSVRPAVLQPFTSSIPSTELLGQP